MRISRIGRVSSGTLMPSKPLCCWEIIGPTVAVENTQNRIRWSRVRAPPAPLDDVSPRATLDVPALADRPLSSRRGCTVALDADACGEGVEVGDLVCRSVATSTQAARPIFIPHECRRVGRSAGSNRPVGPIRKRVPDPGDTQYVLRSHRNVRWNRNCRRFSDSYQKSVRPPRSRRPARSAALHRPQGLVGRADPTGSPPFDERFSTR